LSLFLLISKRSTLRRFGDFCGHLVHVVAQYVTKGVGTSVDSDRE
jgi:hypothetical protein